MMFIIILIMYFSKSNKSTNNQKDKRSKSPGLFSITGYIHSLDDYSLKKPVKRSFKHARVGRSYQQCDADSADMTSLSKQNLKVRFLLIVIMYLIASSGTNLLKIKQQN